jgi:hypothetical protein
MNGIGAGGYLPGVMRPRSEVDHSPSFSGEVRTSTPSIRLHVVQRGQFTFFVYMTLDNKCNITCHVN